MRTRVQRRNLDSLLEDLMEPVGRQARRRALEAVQRASRSTSEMNLALAVASASRSGAVSAPCVCTADCRPSAMKELR
jgi:hypothetical protein